MANASSIGVTAANPRFSYTVIAFDVINGDRDQPGVLAKYNAFTPAISDGMTCQ